MKTQLRKLTDLLGETVASQFHGFTPSEELLCIMLSNLQRKFHLVFVFKRETKRETFEKTISSFFRRKREKMMKEKQKGKILMTKK